MKAKRAYSGRLDGEAIKLFGHRGYATIPKSVFATIAWHLANVSSGYLDGADAALARFFEEWRILHEQGIVRQGPKRAYAAVVTR